jgi:D-serine deaminase-like pyridoxal phosphate-dependent protein
VCVDGALQIEQLGRAARAQGTTIEVLIEADVGAARCGVGDADEAIALARAIEARRPFLVLRGLQAYHGPAQHLRSAQERAVAIGLAAARAAKIANALRGEGFAIAEICGGGTGTYAYELGSEVYTEVQPGSYVLMDTDYGANQPDPDVPLLAQALGVWCTVITSRPGHAVLDGGLKAFAVDSGLPRVLEPGWTTRGLSDEHAVIVPHGQARPLEVGEKIRLVPGHCDPTVNLHDWLVAHRGDRVEAVWAIDARGALF